LAEIGDQLLRACSQTAPIGGLAHDGDVWGVLQGVADAVACKGVVVGEDDADRGSGSFIASLLGVGFPRPYSAPKSDDGILPFQYFA